MNDISISVRNLGKLYKIGAVKKSYKTFRETLMGKFKKNKTSEQSSECWALKDVSFDIKKGEVVGIIGKNGAGKSTLLKILSRITEPTVGEVDLYGRVGSLLEVGTGFHPELTGRENIYLNGAILGMKRIEISKKFDEIVSFAELEKFIDTPVKHYSSGMYMRLAFAVAAHMDTEILLVDEVLAVGDAAFQKKCLGKMGEISSKGRTVLFVSHNTPMVLRLCSRVLFFEDGNLRADGEADKVTKTYLSFGKNTCAEQNWETPKKAPGDNVARLRAVRILNSNGKITETIDILETFFIEIEYWNFREDLKPTAVIHLINQDGITLFASNDFNNLQWREAPRFKGVVKARCRIPGNFLAEGTFYVLAAVNTYNPNVVHALERDCLSFQVIDRSEGDGVRGAYVGGRWPGVMRPMLEWQIETENRIVY